MIHVYTVDITKSPYPDLDPGKSSESMRIRIRIRIHTDWKCNLWILSIYKVDQQQTAPLNVVGGQESPVVLSEAAILQQPGTGQVSR